MKIAFRRVEQCVEGVTDGIDGLVGAILAERKYPFDVAFRNQTKVARQELRTALVTLLTLINIEDEPQPGPAKNGLFAKVGATK